MSGRDCLVLTTVLVLCEAVLAGPPRRTDQAGDLLPPGAVARIGSLRLTAPGPLTRITFAPDGRTVAAAVAEARQASVFLWDATSGRVLRRCLVPGDVITALAFSPDSRAVAVAGFNGPVSVIDADESKVVSRIELAGHPICSRLAFSPDGRFLAASEECHPFRPTPPLRPRSAVHVWDRARGRPLHRLALPGEDVFATAFSPDGKTLAVAEARSEGFPVSLWEPTTGKRVGTITRPGASRGWLEYLPDGSLLLGLTGGEWWLVDPASGKRLRTYRVGGAGGPGMPVPSADGKVIAMVGEEDVSIWDTASAQLKSRLAGPGPHGLRPPCWISLSPDGKTLASGDDTQAVRLWDVGTRRLRSGDEGPVMAIDALAFSPDGKRLVVGGRFDPFPRVYDAATGRTLVRLGAHEHGARMAAWSADGRQVATADRESGGRVRLWDAQTGKARGEFEEPEHRPCLRCLGFLADGRTVVSADQNGELWLWEPGTGRKRSPEREPEGTNGAALSPDGLLLATAHLAGAATGDPSFRGLRLCETLTGKERTGFAPEAGRLAFVAFSPDGRSLVAGPVRGGAWGWEVVSGQRRWRLEDDRIHPHWPTVVALSPDGRLAALGVGSQVVVHDLATGRTAVRFEGDMGAVRRLAFSPDGRRLASGHDVPGALVWDVEGLCRPLPAGKGDPAALAALWEELAGDAEPAFRALWGLVSVPDLAVSLFRERLVADRATDDRARRLVAELENRSFAARESASRSLARLGTAAEPVLRETLRGGPPAETARRVRELLDSLPWARMREVRAVEGLERCGTKEARELLRELAEGRPGLVCTSEARAALERLKDRPAR